MVFLHTVKLSSSLISFTVIARFLLTRRLSEELDISQRTVIRYLNTIGKVNRRCREVPRDLTENQTQNHVETCRKLLAEL